MTVTDPAALLREAAALMREQHGPGHVRHSFWQALAGWLEHTASEAEGALTRTLLCKNCGGYLEEDCRCGWTDALAVARAYLGRTDG